MTTPTSPLEIDIVGSLDDTLNSVIQFLPKLLIFLVVLFVGWIIAKAVAKGLEMLLQKVGFGKLLQKAGADDLMRNAQIDPIGIITKLVYYFILLIALQLALTAFGPTNPVSQIVNDIVAWLPKAIVAIVIVIIAAAIANAVADLMGASLGGLSYGPLLTKIAKGFIIALGIIAALNQVGIAATVTMPVLIAVLATVGGILVVGVGGGMIGPMRQRWEGWLNTFEQETRKVSSSSTASSSTTASPGARTSAASGTPPPPPPPPPATPPSGTTGTQQY